MPEALPSVPGFSEQQVHDLINIVHSVIQQYFTPSNQSPSTAPPSTAPPSTAPPSTAPPSTAPPSTPPPSTPPTPQEARKEEDQQPLYQATVKDTTESTTESTTTHGSSMPDSQSTLSTIPRLCTAQSSGDSAACLSNALLLACQHAMFLNMLGYIEHSKDSEATGQG